MCIRDRLYHVPLRDKSSLCAYLMVPAALPVALLFVYWFLRMVCGICSALVDVVVWICLLAVGEATAHSVRQTAFAGRALPMVGMLLLIWAFSYTLFSLHGEMCIRDRYLPGPQLLRCENRLSLIHICTASGDIAHG